MQTCSAVYIINELEVDRRSKGSQNKVGQILRRFNDDIPQYPSDIPFPTRLLDKLIRIVNTIQEGFSIWCWKRFVKVTFEVAKGARRWGNFGENLLSEDIVRCRTFELKSWWKICNVKEACCYSISELRNELRGIKLNSKLERRWMQTCRLNTGWTSTCRAKYNSLVVEVDRLSNFFSILRKPVALISTNCCRPIRQATSVDSQKAYL